MKKCVKVLSCLTAILAVLFSSHVSLYASPDSNKRVPPDDFGSPVNVITYIDDDGCTVTEKMYLVLDEKQTRDKSGSGWYKNEKTKEWTGGSTSTYYAQGYFTWGDGDVSVTSASGGISSVSGITISNRSTTSGTGRYGYLFNKYAYVTFSCTATNSIGLSQDFSVTIRVSESGNTI